MFASYTLLNDISVSSLISSTFNYKYEYSTGIVDSEWFFSEIYCHNQKQNKGKLSVFTAREILIFDEILSLF